VGKEEDETQLAAHETALQDDIELCSLETETLPYPYRLDTI
jgi:hypothetical protein